MQGTTGLLPAANAWFNNPGMGYFPGSTVAGFNPMQRHAWNSGINASNSVSNMGGRMMDMFSGQMPRVNAQQIGMSNMNMFNNPHLERSVNAALQQANTSFNRNVMPGLTQNSIGAGGAGGSRAGIAQGLAMGDHSRNLANTAAGMHNQNYQNALGSYLSQRGQDMSMLQGNQQANLQGQLANQSSHMQRLGMMPGMMSSYSNSQMAPYMMQNAIGNQQQQHGQSVLNSEQQRWNYYRDRPLNMLNSYAGLLGTTQGLPLQQAGQGNMAGYGLAGLGNAFMNMNWGGNNTGYTPQQTPVYGGFDQAWNTGMGNQNIGYQG